MLSPFRENQILCCPDSITGRMETIMIINTTHLKEVYLKSVKKLAIDEHFYAIQNAKNYVLSTYGRLFKLLGNGHHKAVKSQYLYGDEAYKILFDDLETEITIPVYQLMSRVFFPEEQIFRLYNPHFSDYNKRWKVEDLQIVRTKEAYVNMLCTKMAGEKIQSERNSFEGRWNLPKGETVQNALKVLYRNMKTRATNKKYKQLNPQYKYSTMSQEWLDNPSAFKAYWLDKIYFYPGKLTLDKDIMGFGNTNHYAAGLVIPIPVYINDIFVRSASRLGYCISEHTRKDGTKYYTVPMNVFALEDEERKNIICDNYEEALKAGRKKKANYIRKIVTKERKMGYIPNYILDVIEQWAELCEAGQIRIWEPEFRNGKGCVHQ